MATGTIQTPVDRIIEQGTSGIWTYRKWASGKYECWGKYVESTASAFSATGNVYYRAINGITLPITFAAVPVITATIDFGNVGSCSVGAGTASFNIGVLSSVSTARAVTVHVMVRGLWQ